MSDLLQKMHLSVKLSVAEILDLEQGHIPESLRIYVRDGLDQLAKGYYGHALAVAVQQARKDQAA